jgi:hypothetical protein
MSEITFEDRLPFATDIFLHKLYVIRDALLRNSFKEANTHIEDILTVVQNEIDWCYRTDPVLAYMRDYLLELRKPILSLYSGNADSVKTVVLEISAIIIETMEELAAKTAGISRWSPPDSSIDMLERKHRAYTYGYNEAEKSDSKNS